MSRIEKLLNNRERPVQIIFAGKAHPADRPGHEVIKNIQEIAWREGFRGKVFLVENYNMTLARNLVQGVDIWLNNPRRPLEASGTSGMKVSINGIVNCSIFDGWWCEGYNGKNGWVINDDTTYDNEHYQDDADSQSLYTFLKNRSFPVLSKRRSRDPREWIKIMKESIQSLLLHSAPTEWFRTIPATFISPALTEASRSTVRLRVRTDLNLMEAQYL